MIASRVLLAMLLALAAASAGATPVARGVAPELRAAGPRGLDALAARQSVMEQVDRGIDKATAATGFSPAVIIGIVSGVAVLLVIVVLSCCCCCASGCCHK